jgi:hypothetical protein
VENSLIITKDARIISINVTVIAITFSEKNVKELLSHRPAYIPLTYANSFHGVCILTYLTTFRKPQVHALQSVERFQHYEIMDCETH